MRTSPFLLEHFHVRTKVVRTATAWHCFMFSPHSTQTHSLLTASERPPHSALNLRNRTTPGDTRNRSSMEIILFRSMPIIFVAALISSVTAYACSEHHRTKSFIAITTGYWCAAALVHTVVFSRVDLEHLLVSLLAVAPLVWLPCLILSFCVSGKLTHRVVIPVAILCVVIALPVAIYSNMTASCRILHTIATCLSG